MNPISASAKLKRVPLECRLTPQDVLRALADDPLPFALTGDWAGGGAVLGSTPLTVADAKADPLHCSTWCHKWTGRHIRMTR